MQFFELLKTQHHIDLNDQQRQAVEHRTGPALVLAGPGSGKTTVITARIAYLCLACGINPKRILSITYSRASAHDMGERFQKIYGEDIPEKVRFSTIHSLCNRIVRDYEQQQGHEFTRIDDLKGTESKKAVLAAIYQQVNHQRPGEDEAAQLDTDIGLVKNKILRTPAALESKVVNFSEIYDAYEAYKRERWLIDFDDMLTVAYQILRKCPNILEKYRRWYPYVQVDEAQDASRIQFAVIYLLVGGLQNLFVVADDDQSIYGFRGAAPEEILSIQKTYPNCKIFKLEKNYRSTENIVEISSRLIKANTARYDKQHITDNAKAADPVLKHCDNDSAQLEYVTDLIRESLQTQPESTMAVLYRNNLSAIPIVDRLDRAGIPFHLREGNLFFFSNWVVLDVLAILHFAMDPADADAFLRFYYKIHRYLSKQMAEYAVNWAEMNGEMILDALSECPGLKPFQADNMRKLAAQFQALAIMSAGNALRFIKDSFQYLNYVEQQADRMQTSVDNATGMFHLLEDIAQFCHSVPELLERIGQLDDIFHGRQKKEQRAGAVLTLSTLHSSKGLEFDTVFMVDLTQQEIPGESVAANPIEEKDALEEERRLYYVGMTRARRSLYLLFPAMLRGVPQQPSLFMEETARCMRPEQEYKTVVPYEQSSAAAQATSDAAVAIGQTVRHKLFGKGTVTEVKQSNGYITVFVNFSGNVKMLDWGLCQRTGLAG